VPCRSVFLNPIRHYNADRATAVAGEELPPALRCREPRARDDSCAGHMHSWLRAIEGQPDREAAPDLPWKVHRAGLVALSATHPAVPAVRRGEPGVDAVHWRSIFRPTARLARLLTQLFQPLFLDRPIPDNIER